MTKKIGTICLIVGVVMVCTAVVLLLKNNVEEKLAAKAVLETMPALQKRIIDHTGTVSDPVDSQDNAQAPTEKTIRVGDNDYIGYLSIQSLGLELPVMGDWSYPKLKIAPCRCYGSICSNDLVIAGHNYEKHFKHLKDLQQGDLVTFTDADNLIYVFKVAKVETILPTQVEEMLQSGWPLSLYTCTANGTSRVAVRCERVYEYLDADEHY